MSAGHDHDVKLPARDRRRVRIVLLSIVIPLLAATIIGVVALWPSGDSPVRSQPLLADDAYLQDGTVVAMGEEDADTGVSPMLEVELGPGTGEGRTVDVVMPPSAQAPHLDVGDDIIVMFTPESLATSGTPYVFWDVDRSAPILTLALIYLLVVFLVARLKGLAAVVGLVSSTVLCVLFVLPGILLGHPPVLVALVGASAMMFLAIYLAHGISIRTTTALLGTFLGLAITVAFAAWGTSQAHLSGAGGEDISTLNILFPELSMSDVLLCGIVIASLGALNDVTITQVSAVWELHAANQALSRRRLFWHGMRIGRDHVASTVYTLAFAYVGTALPVLLMASLIDRPWGDTLLSGEIAEEVVRTLVASIGLVLAIPITTAIAAFLVRPGVRTPAVLPHTPATNLDLRAELRENNGVFDADGREAVTTIASTTKDDQ